MAGCPPSGTPQSGRRHVTGPLVHPHDPAWTDWFTELRRRLRPCLHVGATSIEHVGSTAVPGLAAKPVVDIDIVTGPGGLDAVREVLNGLGYRHVGDQGVPGREVFKLTDASLEADLPRHHLYVCEEGSAALRSHRMFRDYLRSRPERVKALSAEKVDAAERAGHDRKAYMELKAPAYARLVAAAILVGGDRPR